MHIAVYAATRHNYRDKYIKYSWITHTSNFFYLYYTTNQTNRMISSRDGTSPSRLGYLFFCPNYTFCHFWVALIIIIIIITIQTATPLVKANLL